MKVSLPDGTEVVHFASNDYLGLASHPKVVAAAHEALDRWGAGAGSARLVVGSRQVHDRLEAELADWKDCEAAVLFPTGFAANLGVLSVLGTPDALIVSDELNHASIIDGCRLARAEVRVARHGDLDQIESLLEARGDRRGMVVTDTVFSMDGDVAAVDDLAAICERHRALLVLDEAHAVLGPEVPQFSEYSEVQVVRVGTLSKMLGSLGGFVAASREICDLLVNTSRPYIFTTATPPADSAAALEALSVLTSEEGRSRVAHLRELVKLIAPGHPSPIIPRMVGEESAALDASESLLEQGFLVPAIRPPTVAPGTSRLRVALSAEHTEDQVSALARSLDLLGIR